MIDDGQGSDSPLVGVKVVMPRVEIIPSFDAPLSEEHLQQQVEKALERAGIRINGGKDTHDVGWLHVCIMVEHQWSNTLTGTHVDRMKIHNYAVLVEVSIMETVCLCRNPEVRILVKTWCPLAVPTLLVVPSNVLKRKVSEILDKQLAEFTESYFRENPELRPKK